ncbi:MAG: RluA family pseudouridine synthase [Rhodospirillaceae bacterium]|nr:RluA family pseudouridine synthase [Rhodospirillaceae bacterium]
MSGVQQFTITAADGDQRLDRWFKRKFPHLTHGRLEKLLRTGQVRIDGKRAKAADRLTAGMIVRVPPLGDAAEPRLDDLPSGPKPITAKDAEALRKAVLFKDADVIVINKPAGLAVQGGTGLDKNIDAMLEALQFDAPERPRLVHRLDRDTSGCLVLARSQAAARKLAEAFRHKTARKIYWAVTVGAPKMNEGKIDAPLVKQSVAAVGRRSAERVQIDEDEGKKAITYYAVVERAHDKAAWLALMPVTGRTHQLRAHCVALGTPILGDGKYAGAKAYFAREALDNQLHLHARSIRMPHPTRGIINVTAPLPPHMQKTWKFFEFADEPDEDPFAGLEL